MEMAECKIKLGEAGLTQRTTHRACTALTPRSAVTSCFPRHTPARVESGLFFLAVSTSLQIAVDLAHCSDFAFLEQANLFSN